MIKLLLIILVAIAVIIAGPLITIWSLNTLFHTAIDSNSDTWFAMLWLQMIIGAAAANKSKKD